MCNTALGRWRIKFLTEKGTLRTVIAPSWSDGSSGISFRREPSAIFPPRLVLEAGIIASEELGIQID
jgi:hypothetical protein